jgi:hypothetical protein
MLIGVGMALTFLLCVGVIILALYVSSVISGDASGVGGLVGFMILPIAALAGLPWSVLTIHGGSRNLFLLGIIAGPIINGAVVGAVRGYITMRRSRSDQQ